MNNWLAVALWALGCSLPAPAGDAFDRLSQINRASIVMLSETGLVPILFT